MTLGLLLSAALAGAAYTITPGPGFVALLGIAAGQGRAAGAAFVGGHFAGDVLWASLALAAILGTQQVGALFFDLLGLACGAYLLWLGLRALGVRTRSDGEDGTVPTRRPLARGLAFGLTNPKAYPVALATFTALLAGDAAALDWSSFPPLLAAACAGFLAADVIIVVFAGAGAVRRIYRRHETWIVRASGLLFIGFAANALAHAVPGLVARRP